MRITKLKIPHFKVLENIDIDFGDAEGSVHPVISVNGGGKSTLLQFVFTLLHFGLKPREDGFVNDYMGNITSGMGITQNICTLNLSINNNNQYLNFKKLASNTLLNNHHKVEEIQRIIKNISIYERLMTLLEQIKLDFRRKSKDYSIELIESFVETLNQLYSSKEEADEDISFYFDVESLIIGEGGFDDEIQVEETYRVLPKVHKKIIEIVRNRFLFLSKKQKELDEIIDLNGLYNKDTFAYLGKSRNEDSHFILESNCNDEEIKSISDNIHIISPITQLIHFAPKSLNDELFVEDSYYFIKVMNGYVNRANNFSVYNYFPRKLVVNTLKEARNNDFKLALETSGNYGSELKAFVESLNFITNGNSFVIDDINKEEDEFLNIHLISKSGEKINVSSLSHGELKKLNIFLWLHQMKHKEGIFLMDEVDLGLHPSWQMDIVQELREWASKGQFLLATHSPQIIASSDYKDIVILNKNEETGKSESFSVESPPVGADVNSIINTIMGAEYLPKKLKDLYKSYEEIVKNGEEETKEGQEIKAEIMEIESESSKFLQRMSFISAINKRKATAS